MKCVVAQCEKVISFVPAKLEEGFAGMEHARVLSDRIGAVEVEYLEAALADDEQLA